MKTPTKPITDYEILLLLPVYAGDAQTVADVHRRYSLTWKEASERAIRERLRELQEQGSIFIDSRHRFYRRPDPISSVTSNHIAEITKHAENVRLYCASFSPLTNKADSLAKKNLMEARNAAKETLMLIEASLKQTP